MPGPAGDLWLNGHALTVDGGTSSAQEGSPWLGGVGRTGEVVTTGTTSVVAYDLSSSAVDNLKSNTTPVLTTAQLAHHKYDWANGEVTAAATQDGVDYGTAVAAPEAAPSRPDDSADWDWQFTGWYTDAACTQQFDFSTALTDSWTTLYAGWKKVDVEKPEQPGGGSDTTDKTDDTEKKPAKGNLPQTGDISVIATAAVAAAGAVAAGAGAAIKRRRK